MTIEVLVASTAPVESSTLMETAGTMVAPGNGWGRRRGKPQFGRGKVRARRQFEDRTGAVGAAAFRGAEKVAGRIHAQCSKGFTSVGAVELSQRGDGAAPLDDFICGAVVVGAAADGFSEKISGGVHERRRLRIAPIGPVEGCQE